MICCFVGTHEQQFDRMVDAADELALRTSERVFVQYGYSRKPRFADGVDLLTADRLEELIENSRIIVTHGGPGSIWDSLKRNKIPVVMPRLRVFGEHVDDHQKCFVEHLKRHKRVIAVSSISELITAVDNYERMTLDIRQPDSIGQQNRSKLIEILNAWLS